MHVGDVQDCNERSDWYSQTNMPTQAVLAADAAVPSGL